MPRKTKFWPLHPTFCRKFESELRSGHRAQLLNGIFLKMANDEIVFFTCQLHNVHFFADICRAWEGEWYTHLFYRASLLSKAHSSAYMTKPFVMSEEEAWAPTKTRNRLYLVRPSPDPSWCRWTRGTCHQPSGLAGLRTCSRRHYMKGSKL